MRNGEGEAFGRRELRHRHAQHFASGGVEDRATGISGVERRTQRPPPWARIIGIHRPQPAVRDDVFEPLAIGSHAGATDDDNPVAILMLEPIAQAERWDARVDRQECQVVLRIFRNERHAMPGGSVRGRIKKQGLDVLGGFVGHHVIVGDQEPRRRHES